MASKKKSKRGSKALPVPPDLFTEEKRKPGRPKKVTAQAAEVPVKRKPGRPRKNPLPEAAAAPVKRKPGRPRKNPLPEVEVSVTPKRKPGRPKKVHIASNGNGNGNGHRNGHGYSIQVKLHGGATLSDIVQVAEALKGNPAVQSVDGTFF